MYCRLPNAVQLCPKRAPRFVRRQTFRRVRVSAIISLPPPFLDRQTTIFLFSTISSLECIFAKRDFYSIKITFLLRSPNFRSFARRSSYTLLSTGRSLETTHALLGPASMVSANPRDRMGKEKKKKEIKKKKTIDAAKRTVAMKEGGMGRKGILARGYHDLSRYKVENVDDRASSRRFHVADARQKASTAAKIIGAFPLIPDTRVTRSISME